MIELEFYNFMVYTGFIFVVGVGMGFGWNCAKIISNYNIRLTKPNKKKEGSTKVCDFLESPRKKLGDVEK